MIYQNLEIFNTAELYPHPDGGVTWTRVPKSVYDAMESDSGKNMARGSTGVEFRFVLKGKEAKLRIRSLSAPNVLCFCHVFYGAVQGGWECHELNCLITNTPCELVIRRPSKEETVRKMTADFGLEFDSSVVRVILDRGEYHLMSVDGDIEPPSKALLPKRTLLSYGSSITHGSNAFSMSDSWVSQVAHRLGADARNLGFAGSCRMEPAMVDYIAAQGEVGSWDIATLELGINVLGWQEEQINERVTNTLREIAGRNPTRPIFVISPFYCNDDYVGGGQAKKWRDRISAIIEALQLPNVTYLCGTDLLPDMSYISADAVHPNIYGVRLIADRLTEAIKSKLNEK